MVNDALRPLGIQGPHLGVLLLLGRDGPLSQRELIDRLGSDKASMVRTIDDLEGRGLCRRTPSTTDRRAHAVQLTPAGQRLLTDAEHIAGDVGDALLARLTRDQQAQLHTLLRLVVDGSS